MFVVMTASRFAVHRPFHWEITDYAFYVVLNLLIWPIGGYVWGVWVWSSMEKRFSKE